VQTIQTVQVVEIVETVEIVPIVKRFYIRNPQSEIRNLSSVV
jgi:hypothetical protein